MRQSEEKFLVSLTSEDMMVVKRPNATYERLRMHDVQAIYVETNDRGPWDADVWWLLEGPAGKIDVSFPQLAAGEADALRRLSQLPGFEIKGMNSASNARFECWKITTS